MQSPFHRYSVVTHKRIDELTNQEGVSVAIEAVGLPSTFTLAVELAAFAGRVVYIGYAKQPVSYETRFFVAKELNIRGSRNALRVFPAVIKMLEKREHPYKELISRVYPFDQVQQAFVDWDHNRNDITKILVKIDD